MSQKVHMTRAGHEQLSEELRRLKGVERPAISAAIGRAREHGDISENAEYDAAKEKQAMIEARIRLVEDRLARAEIVDTSGQPPDVVRFGTTVVLEDLDTGDEVTYRIVGEDEADVSRGLLSVTSPVARALIGKRVEDQVQVVVPKGRREYEVRNIRFDA
ncbi:MAG TPA: transcription elongation factor GreA [Myxococcota bacterium]|nr:transcription elongation factor GreA [Myxococcota bacterium]